MATIIFIFFIVIFCFLVTIYWGSFWMENYEKKIKTKKDFLLSFLVFYWWVVEARTFWRDLP